MLTKGSCHVKLFLKKALQAGASELIYINWESHNKYLKKIKFKK